MKINSVIKAANVYPAILYILGFFLFLEWLYPIQQITDTSNLPVFMVYAVFCFILSILQVKWWLSFPLKGGAMLLVIHMLFVQGGFLDVLWLQDFVQEVTYNIQLLINQNWYELTPLFRSLLFLVLIWLMSYLLYYWFVIMNRIFLFVLLTIIYMTVLDTFTVYDANGAIIRTFIFSLLAFGLANIMKVTRREEIRFFRTKKSFIWALPLIGVVLFSALIGYASPKFAPKWPDPVPFFQNAADGNGYSGDGEEVHKVGYGEDDSQLGGSFVQDHTPVFQATAKGEHYWRIETKDVYTGKGWESAESADYVPQNRESLDLTTFDDSVETEKQETGVEFQGNTAIKKLLYPYGVQEVETNDDVDLLLDRNSGEIRTQKGGTDVNLQHYTLKFDEPSFAIDRLKKHSSEDPEEIIEQYTQIPDHLPDRVRDLAKDITKGKTSRYEKAKAIEQYFGENGYTYETSDVPVPNDDEDYVDEFLFDSKKGYCDNYSTSMVVMLRSLGIPTRWAKGFTSGEKVPGEYTDDPGEAYDNYEVTNSNAHSWPEVYFPDTGWVPFEPTQGFSNLSDFHESEQDSNKEADKQDESEDESEDRKGSEEEDDQEAETDAKTSLDQKKGQTRAEKGYQNWIIAGSVMVIILLLALLGYLLRFRLMTAYYLRKLKHHRDRRTFQDAYHYLLTLLKHKGIAIEQGETLREYAKRIDWLYGMDEMQVLTDHYEQLLYRNQLGDMATSDLIDRWQYVVKQILA